MVLEVKSSVGFVLRVSQQGRSDRLSEGTAMILVPQVQALQMPNWPRDPEFLQGFLHTEAPHCMSEPIKEHTRPRGWNITKSADYTHTAYVCGLQRESRVLWWPVYMSWTGPNRAIPGSSLRISQVSVIFPRLPVAPGTQQGLSQRLVTATFNSRLEASLGPQPSSINPPQTHLKVAIPSISDMGD